MTDGGYQIFPLDKVKIRDCLFMMSPFCPTSPSPVMKDWGGVAVSRQEADNQITQDYVSHLTCMDPVSVLKSVIQSTEDFFFVCLCVWERENRRQINSQSCSVFSYFFCISISLTHTLSASFSLFFSCDSLPSCGKGLLMNVDEHVGNVWVSTTAFPLSDRSSTRL